MALFRITIEKYYAQLGEYWTNIYHVEAADVVAAGQQIANFANAERPLYPAEVVITKGRADDMVPNTDQFVTQVFNAAGTRAAPAGGMFPLFCTLRCDFSTSGVGSPSRKYLRGVLFEADGGMLGLEAGIKTAAQTYIDTVVALPYKDVDGQDLTNGVPWNGVQMRQVRRGSKKKITP